MHPLYSAPGMLCGDTFLGRRRRRLPALSLLSALVAHWRLDEAVGTRFDAAGLNHLLPTGAVGQTEGKLGFAAQFVPVNGECLSCPGSNFNMAGTSFTLAGWLCIEALTAAGIAGKSDAEGLEYPLWYDGANLCFSVSADGFSPVTASIAFQPETGAWHHFAAWYDLAAGTVNLSLDAQAPASAACEGGVHGGAAALVLGRDALSGLGLGGRLDSVSVWRRVLSAPERARLYNDGAGLDYPF